MTSSPSDAFLRAIRDAAPSDRMAHRLGVHTLYKFRAFRTPRDKERVRDILINHRVWFAEPSTFEDPHDLKPMLRIRKFPTETEARFALLAAAVRTWDRNRESTPDRLRHRRWLMNASLDRIEQRAMERSHARLNSYLVLSLADTRDRVEMWDRYADQQRGLCIHFSAVPPSPFSIAQRVEYLAQRPVLPVPFDDLTEHQVAAIATLGKTRSWNFEDEFRVVRYPNVPYEEIGLIFDGQIARFPADVVTGITVGIRMPEAEVAEVLALAESRDPPLRVDRPKAIVSDNIE